jgi:transcription-repair coupling factor (superfamily II helicase)
MHSPIIERIEGSKSVEDAIGAISGAAAPVRLSGLAGSSLSIFLSILNRRLGATLAVVSPDDGEALKEDLDGLVGEERALLFPDWEVLPYDEFSPHEAIIGARLRTLSAIAEGRPAVVVIPLRALLRTIIPPEDLAASSLGLAVGQQVRPHDLVSTLVEIGYSRAPVVEDVGTFATRGGILDVYPQGTDCPIRIEMVGDQIESMREFDPFSQRSVKKVERARILPAREVVLGRAAVDRFLASLGGPRARKAKLKDLEDVVMHVKDRFFFDGIEAYAPGFYSRQVTVQAYLPADARYVLVDREALEEKARAAVGEAEVRFREGGGEARAFPRPETAISGFDQVISRVPPANIVEISPLDTSRAALQMGFRTGEPFAGNLRVLSSAIADAAREGYTTYILCDNIGQVERLEELVSQPGESEGLGGAVSIGVGHLREGFTFPEAQLRVITDHEIFGRYKRKHRYPRFKGEGPIESYRALNVGDFVVHVNHGIGRYGGVQELTVEGRETECLLVHYQDGDKLYVPIEQLDLLQKYIGKDSEPPALSKLGGAGWERIKARTKKAIKEMAEELIRIYALRQARAGHAFKPDSRWQKELEASFIYDDTVDQARTAEEIKRDMERPKPMDRLVCGDVGYGKTEVAIRAAFKAVTEGKQVAVLVPTTVLAQQHFYTFGERLADYPVVVEMLSRFRTAKMQREIIAGLAAGTVDIAIGTHRLIQKDVAFKDLGLVIIDEEQRFGVAHKETFKKMRATVDVLTLTATPIPRTLHMALMGARDMSTIDTPPKDRLPVETEVLQFDEDVVVTAVLRELDRGGQVFFVHNRVESIDSVAAHLAGLMPEMRIAIAHGQMHERELERVMLDFIEKKYDILVSTMIVESGLDIPNVNTIIVNQADTLGLAQLYQLRGRVGRSRHRAYAYLLVPKGRRLTDIQRKRLKTIMEFTELGSGLKIAMRDLEIRGVGNILGPEQSGYIAEVGFDLYVKLLEEAVKELKGEPVEPRIETKIETDLAALLPAGYVEDPRQRVVFYKRLVETRKVEDVDALAAEIEDRYGALPEAAWNLLDFQKIRILAAPSGMERVVVKKSLVFLEIKRDARLPRAAVESMVRAGLTIELEAGERPGIRLADAGGVGTGAAAGAARERLALVRRVLQAILESS